MKRLWVASLLVFCLACTGADRRDPMAIQKATVALQAGELEKARMHAENAYHAAPDDPEARKVLAAVHRALGERAEGEGAMGRASDAYVRAAEREPFRRQRAQDYYHAYENARDAGRDRATAAQLLLRSLEAEPNNLEVRLAAATAFDEIGQVSVAIEHYLYVWEADRTALPVGLRLGTLYASTGAVDDAEAVFRRVIEQDPENVQAQLQLADVYEKAGRGSRSRAIYQALTKKYPDNPMLLFRFADFLERSGDREAAEDLRDEARGELPGVKRRKMRDLKSRRKKKKR